MQGYARDTLPTTPATVANDAPPEQVPSNVFTSATNIVMRDGIATRADGYQETLGTPLFEVEYLINLNEAGANYWIYAGRDGIGVTDGQNHFDITPVEFVPTDDLNQWTGAIFNGYVLLNNGKFAPTYWPGGTNEICEPIPEWPEDYLCKALRVFQNHIIAMDITDDVGRFRDWFIWSDAAEVGSLPETWQAAADNEAGNAVLSATQGAIIDGGALKDEFILYKSTSTYAMRYIGGNFIFQIRKVLDTSGLKSRNAFTESRGVHFVFTDHDIIEFDGQSYQSLVDANNKNYLFKSLTAETAGFVFCVANTLETEIYFFYPTQPNVICNRALVWSRDANAWGEVEIEDGVSCAARGLVPFDTGFNTWDTIPGNWNENPRKWGETTYLTTSDSILFALPTLNQFNNLGASVDRNGAPVSTYLLKQSIALGNEQRRRLYKRLWPKIDGVQGTELLFRIGAQDTPNSSIKWTEQKSFIVGETEKIDCFVSGRLLCYEITSDSLQPWRLTGLDVEHNLQGGF